MLGKRFRTVVEMIKMAKLEKKFQIPLDGRGHFL